MSGNLGLSAGQRAYRNLGSDDASEDTSEAREQVAEKVWSSLYPTETVGVSSFIGEESKNMHVGY